MSLREQVDLVDDLADTLDSRLTTVMLGWGMRYSWSDLVAMMTYNVLVGPDDALSMPPKPGQADETKTAGPQFTPEEWQTAHRILEASVVYTPSSEGGE